jgi:hypothetical protein
MNDLITLLVNENLYDESFRDIIHLILELIQTEFLEFKA